VGKLEDAEKIIDETPAEEATIETVPNNEVKRRVENLLETRRTELQQGITESETKKILSEIKPVADQFNFIANIATDIRKISLQLKEV